MTTELGYRLSYRQRRNNRSWSHNNTGLSDILLDHSISGFCSVNSSSPATVNYRLLQITARVALSGSASYWIPSSVLALNGRSILSPLRNISLSASILLHRRILS